MRLFLSIFVLIISLLFQGITPAVAQVLRAQQSSHCAEVESSNHLADHSQLHFKAQKAVSNHASKTHDALIFSTDWLFFSTCDHHCAAMVAMLPSVSLTPALAVPMQGDSLYVFSVSQTLPWRLERPPRA